MPVSNSEILFYTLAFLVPGFVTRSVVSGFLSLRKEADNSLFLQYITLSCIQYGFWSWLIFLIHTTDCIHKYPGWAAFASFFLLFVSPVAFGLGISYVHQHDLLRPQLMRLNLNLLHPTRSSWDYKFSRLEAGSWVVVTLKDDLKFFGKYSGSSFAGSEQGERDLYLEQTFRLNDQDDWIPINNSQGVLLMGSEIRAVEFIGFSAP